MSTQPIGYANNSVLGSLLSQVNNQTQTEEQQAAAKQQTEFTGSWKSQIRSQIDSLLKDVPKGDDNKLSFQDIDDYRAKLEKEWDESVKADLKKLGVNTEKEFPLSWDAATGKLTVSKEHPDKEKIDKYFASNEDKVAEFQRIIQLGKMTSMSKENFTPTQMRQNIQKESMAWWYEDNSDPTTWFAGGGLLLGNGNNQASYTGLNLKV